MPDALNASALLTHHWLVRRRGGEKVLDALRSLFPDAPVCTLIADRRVFAAESGSIRTSWLARLPGAIRHYPKLLLLMPLAARAMRLPDADLVLCSDAAIAKAMKPAPRSALVCYCHSPMRYVWEQRISREYARTLPVVLRPLWPAVCAWVRWFDRSAARRVDAFVANSRTVAERIRRCYGRDSTVVYPPVELPPAPGTEKRDDYFLCVGHHVAYKRLDLAVDACERSRRRLVVVGDGPDVARYASRDRRYVQFVGHQPDEALARHYRSARALLFPGEEDFGIVPVEAIAHGCPVIAFGAGGATESVTHAATGLLFQEQTVDCLAAALDDLEQHEFDPLAMHSAMQRFNRERFLDEMRACIRQALDTRRARDRAVDPIADTPQNQPHEHP